MKMWVHSRWEIERIEKVDGETAAILLTQRFEQSQQLGNIEQRLMTGQTALRMQEMTMWQNQIEIFRPGGRSNGGFNPTLKINSNRSQQITTQPQYSGHTISTQQI